LALEGRAAWCSRGKPVVLPPMAQTQGSLVLVPREEGEQNLTPVRLPTEPDETRSDNNARLLSASPCAGKCSGC